jgi:hypothetical protein
VGLVERDVGVHKYFRSHLLATATMRFAAHIQATADGSRNSQSKTVEMSRNESKTAPPTPPELLVETLRTRRRMLKEGTA